MRTIYIFPVVCMLLFLACSTKQIRSEGELIYRTGRNKQGIQLLDKQRSQITFIKSCQGCHGKDGTRVRNCNIRWSYLSDPAKLSVPYTDSLFFRFLDEDVKSNGTAAQTGVHWKMRAEDKIRLLTYLKTM